MFGVAVKSGFSKTRGCLRVLMTSTCPCVTASVSSASPFWSFHTPISKILSALIYKFSFLIVFLSVSFSHHRCHHNLLSIMASAFVPPGLSRDNLLSWFRENGVGVVFKWVE